MPAFGVWPFSARLIVGLLGVIPGNSAVGRAMPAASSCRGHRPFSRNNGTADLARRLICLSYRQPPQWYRSGSGAAVIVVAYVEKGDNWRYWPAFLREPHLACLAGSILRTRCFEEAF